jgi:hypothetical protein
LCAAALFEGAAARLVERPKGARVYKAVWANYLDSRHPFEVEREVKL